MLVTKLINYKYCFSFISRYSMVLLTVLFFSQYLMAANMPICKGDYDKGSLCEDYVGYDNSAHKNCENHYIYALGGYLQCDWSAPYLCFAANSCAVQNCHHLTFIIENKSQLAWQYKTSSLTPIDGPSVTELAAEDDPDGSKKMELTFDAGDGSDDKQITVTLTNAVYGDVVLSADFYADYSANQNDVDGDVQQGSMYAHEVASTNCDKSGNSPSVTFDMLNPPSLQIKINMGFSSHQLASKLSKKISDYINANILKSLEVKFNKPYSIDVNDKTVQYVFNVSCSQETCGY